MTGRKTAIVTGASRGIGHATAGVPVNAAAPGEIDTTIRSPGTYEIVDRNIPMHRLGTIEEVADLVWFLCSPQAKYVTGGKIPINGGQHV